MQGRCIPDENGLIQSFPSKNWREEFKILQNIDLKYLEWTIDYENSENNPILNDVFKNEIEELCLQSKIHIFSATADNLMQAPIHKQNKGLTSGIDEVIDMIEKLEYRNIGILVWPLVDGGKISSMFEMEQFITRFEPIKDSLNGKKIKIAFETDFFPEKNQDFMSALAHKNVGINIDIGNLASYGVSLNQELELNKDKIFHFHIKDRILGGHTVPLGEGNVDWNAVKTISEIYSHSLFVLQAARKKLNHEVQTIIDYISFLKTKKILR